ncbi:A/G-specific adenine glycosylase [Flavobacterium sp. '19STA2R22 D10 B1']|uniref:A/G-specific adenine glycosylase n=1 Tax=Flavobacterium aerium TaxID=3037261 RepID=UPI00278C5132|nr:A/G-specific adenine glycosylase [Flavobacterium sp. '19STA2R22 D10 B1']
MSFTKILIQWYLHNKRDLPWRKTQDPYAIWLSEIILQQTRVAQGMPYFFAFLDTFPTVFDLANASEQQVLKLWQGLGYYSRAQNLHKTAQYIASDLNGVFPNNYNDLLTLKGVGEYTAAAIASFCYNEPVPVVDGNVFRVLSRYYDIETDIASNGAKKEFKALAYEIMPFDNPAIFNQALMEFGALQCVPKSPNCPVCVMNDSCVALQKKKVDMLPVKLKKTLVRDRFLNYIIFIDEDNHTQIQQRTAKGIWHNLYEFPLIETEKAESEDFIEDKINEQFSAVFDLKTITLINTGNVNHKLSHQNLNIKFWNVEIKGKIEKGINYDALITYPFPIVLYNFIEKQWPQ